MIAQFAERLSNIGRTIKLTADKATADQISTAHASAFRLGPITVEPALRQITGTRSETLELRSMQVLVILAMANGRIVSRDDPVRQCWEGRIVGDDPVNRVIGRLRKLANEHGGVALRIETITKVGYRLIGAVALMPSTTPQPLAVDGAHNFTTAAPDRLNAIMMRLTSEAPVAKRATVAELRVSRRAAIARGSWRAGGCGWRQLGVAQAGRRCCVEPDSGYELFQHVGRSGPDLLLRRNRRGIARCAFADRDPGHRQGVN